MIVMVMAAIVVKLVFATRAMMKMLMMKYHLVCYHLYSITMLQTMFVALMMMMMLH
jgi:hypothetical protein